MPDTQTRPATSRKLGGIPSADAAAPGIYRKPPSFRMKVIPRPPEPSKQARMGFGRGSAILAWILCAAGIVGGAAIYLRKSSEFTALLERWMPERAAEERSAAPPLDSTPLAEASPGWTWLFDEREWRTPRTEKREYREGLVRLREHMEKPQSTADGVIRARVFVRDGANTAGVFLRSTPEGGRYRLSMDADARHVRLFHQGAAGAHELGKYRFVKPWERGDRVLLELRAEGEKLTASVNGATVIEVADSRSKEAGAWGIEAGDGWFGLVEVPMPVAVPAESIAETPSPAPPPEPVMPPTLPAAEPAPIRGLSETAKWLAGAEPQWQANFQREVIAPFEKGVGDLKREYLGGLEGQLALATQASKLDDAAAFRGERQRISGGEDVPAVDETIVPPALKQMRVRFRSDFARLDLNRFAQAKIFHARTDALLAQSQAALTRQQRAEEAGELKARREHFAALWLKPPAAAPVVAAAKPARPPLGAAPDPLAFAKLPPRKVVEKLLAMGSAVWVDQKGNNRAEIKALSDLAGDRFDITRVDFGRTGPDEKPLSPADFAVVEALGDVVELSLRGPVVTDTIFEKLRTFRKLEQLTLDGAQITATSYALLATLPGLRGLELRSMGTSDEAMKVVGQCRKLTRLSLSNLALGDEGLAPVGKLPALEELNLNDIPKLTSVGIGHLAGATNLRRLNLSGFLLSSPVLDAVARCHALESLTLSGNALKDEQIAGLSALTHLRNLNLNNTGIIGTGFGNWPPRTSMTTLSLSGEPGVTDAALRGIGAAFPRLENLEITGAPLSATSIGFAAIGRLRSLRTLRVSGGVVNDEIAAELAKCDELTSLHIPEGRIGEPGVASLAKLSRLNHLQLDQPPVSEAALKSLAKFKALRTIQLGETTPDESEKKLRAALAGVTIQK